MPPPDPRSSTSSPGLSSASAVGVSSPGSAKNVLTVGAAEDSWRDGHLPGDKSPTSNFGVSDQRWKPEVLAPGQFITSCDARDPAGYRAYVERGRKRFEKRLEEARAAASGQ